MIGIHHNHKINDSKQITFNLCSSLGLKCYLRVILNSVRKYWIKFPLIFIILNTIDVGLKNQFLKSGKKAEKIFIMSVLDILIEGEVLPKATVFSGLLIQFAEFIPHSECQRFILNAGQKAN